MRLDLDLFDIVFKVPNMEKYKNISIQQGREAYNKDQNKYKKLINTQWLKTLRPNISRWPISLPRSDFKEDVRYMITLLSRVKGLLVSSNFQEWMYEYIKIIKRKKKHVDWGTQISDEIHEQLINVQSTLKFYMTSYLVYVVAIVRQFPGLSTEGNRNVVPV